MPEHRASKAERDASLANRIASKSETKRRRRTPGAPKVRAFPDRSQVNGAAKRAIAAPAQKIVETERKMKQGYSNKAKKGPEMERKKKPAPPPRRPAGRS